MRRRRFWNYPRRGKGLVQRWLPSWRVVVGCVLACIALGAGVFFAAWTSTEIPDNLDDVQNQASTVYYANGKEIGNYGETTRELVDYESLPDYVGNAVVASENDSFWDDPGIDVKALAAAAWTTLTSDRSRGGSTLTQQYVERYYVGQTSDLVGKAQEAIIALKITQKQDKPLILERYLNTIYWGRGANGVQAAAQAYFGKDAAELTYSEAAMLSGIIPSPSRWDPSVNLEQAQERWARSIRHMEAQGYITAEEAKSAEFPEFVEKKEATNSLGGQKGYIMAAVRSELEANDVSAEDIESGGLQIYTTIKPKLQNEAAKIVKNMPEDTNEKIRPSIVSIDPETGAILTLYGGQDYVEQNTNPAWEGTVQGGSTFKPFTLIGALEEGHELNETFDGNSPGHLDPEDPNKEWPTNFGKESYGNVDLVKATQNSINTAYVELNIEVGPDKTTEVAHRLGIREDERNPIDAVPSNVLGVAEVRPVDLASAYATIASGGYYVKPHVVDRVEYLNGDTFYQPDVTAESRFEAEDINAATYAMTKVVEEGSGRAARELTGPDGQRRPVAGKTGTTQKNMGAWFAGFTPQLVTVVNLRQYKDFDLEAGVMQGNESIEPFGQWAGDEITGSTWPAQAWTEFMQVALDGEEIAEFPAYTPPRPTWSPTPTPSETTPETVEIPGDLVGMDVARATARLQELGLTVSAQAQNDESAKGTVIRVGGSGAVPAGSTVTLWVSTGVSDEPQGVAVPGVVGQNQGRAEAQIRRLGLQVNVTEQYAQEPAGQVIGMDPGAGNEVEPGSTINLVVSLGPEPQETQEPEPEPEPTDEPEPEPEPTWSDLLPGGGDGDEGEG